MIFILNKKGWQTSNVGSVVEFSPATREARVRFPDVADFWLFNFWNSLMKNSRDARPKSERGLSLVRGISFRIQGLEIKIWGKGRIKYKRFILEPILKNGFRMDSKWFDLEKIKTKDQKLNRLLSIKSSFKWIQGFNFFRIQKKHGSRWKAWN